ncbi:6444_t:CDS:2, partial [Dentiscutata heterogama]
AYKNKFANTQELVCHHLKNCKYFKQKYNEFEQAEILAKSDKVDSATNNSFQESTDDNSATGSEISSTANSLQLDKFQATKIEDKDNDNLNSFSKSILSNISDNEWWKNLIQLKVLLKPYMTSLNKLQQDKGCLTEVLHSFGWLLKTYKQTIAISFEQINPNNDNGDEFILSEENTDNNDIDTEYIRDSDHIEAVKCVDDWKVIVEEWINLTKKDDKHMQSNSS